MISRSWFEILFPIPEQFLSVENGVKGEIRWVRRYDKKKHIHTNCDWFELQVIKFERLTIPNARMQQQQQPNIWTHFQFYDSTINWPRAYLCVFLLLTKKKFTVQYRSPGETH